MDKAGAPDKTVMRLRALGELKTEIDEIGVTLRNRFEAYSELTRSILLEDKIAMSTEFKDDIINAGWDKFAFPDTGAIPHMRHEDDIVERAMR